MNSLVVAVALAVVLLLPNAAAAQTGPFPGADVGLGEKLIRDHGCAQCHARQVGGNGNAIYQPAGRINSASALRGMVELCSTRLNLQLFPEEVDAIAAVLNRDHYKFK